MGIVIFNAYTAEPTSDNTLRIHIMAADAPFPQRKLEIKSTTDLIRQFETYKAEAAATGKPMALSMRMQSGDRKPPGFNKIKAAYHYETVNV